MNKNQLRVLAGLPVDLSEPMVEEKKNNGAQAVLKEEEYEDSGDFTNDMKKLKV